MKISEIKLRMKSLDKISQAYLESRLLSRIPDDYIDEEAELCAIAQEFFKSDLSNFRMTGVIEVFRDCLTYQLNLKTYEQAKKIFKQYRYSENRIKYLREDYGSSGVLYSQYAKYLRLEDVTALEWLAQNIK